MDTIDQRILIPASPTAVWRFVSDITHNVDWQVNCRSISFLTTSHEGRGARWRHTTTRQRDIVIEATAWYEGLGYEYRIVDGVTYSDNRGRLRLQEVAEGTVVQWTFSYSVGGLFGGIRNSVSLRRNIENNIVESLWNLWRQLSEGGKQDGQYIPKSLMRDAPDVEARSAYKPKHPSALQEKYDESGLPSIEANNIQAEPVSISEPPIAEDDTRPRPTIVSEPEEMISEPDFLSYLPNQAPSAPSNITNMDPPQEEKVQVSELKAAQQDIGTTESPQVTDTMLSDTSEPIKVESSEDAPANSIGDQSKTKTEEVSVFEVFGVQKPSSSQQIQTPNPIEEVQSLAPAPEGAIPDEAEANASQRIGMRVVLRRKRIKVRQPD
jgi:hypothetical protein